MQAGAFGLTAGKILVLFPEGERSIDGTVRKFKKGAGILAGQVGAPIVPVAIDGMFEIWPRNRPLDWKRLLPWSGHRVTIRFGRPLAPSDGQDLRHAVEQLWLEGRRNWHHTSKGGRSRVRYLRERLSRSRWATSESLDAISGHFRIFQLKKGHRFSTDDVLTAWYGTTWVPTAGAVLDLGSGIGSVGMIAAWRLPSARFVTIEAQADSVRLARRSAAWNGLEDRYEVRHADFRDHGP